MARNQWQKLIMITDRFVPGCGGSLRSRGASPPFQLYFGISIAQTFGFLLRVWRVGVEDLREKEKDTWE